MNRRGQGSAAASMQLHDMVRAGLRYLCICKLAMLLRKQGANDLQCLTEGGFLLRREVGGAVKFPFECKSVVALVDFLH